MDPKNMPQRVDVTTLPDYEAHMQLGPLINALRRKKRIVVVAGAGISASAGIPTFDNISKGIFDKHMYNSPDSTKILNKMTCDLFHLVQTARATQFHLVLAAIAEEGRLRRLYTQNIDGIDTQLAPLKTLIPLPEKAPWPTTVQLHGNLRTVWCPRDHLSDFDPALFSSESGSLPCCVECEKDVQSKEGGTRPRPIPVLRPRLWLYQDWGYPDADAIERIKAADFKARPDAVILVGTALKVPGARHLARDMCRTAREGGGFTAWINLKAPPRELDCLDLVIKGDCDTVAMHVSSWWLKECPKVLSDVHIQELQEKCKLFVTRTAKAALNRALAEVDDESLSQILQQQENKSRVLNVKENGQAIFLPAEGSQRSGIRTSEAIGHNIEIASQQRKNQHLEPVSALRQSSDILSKLPDCWVSGMSKRLSQVIVRETDTGRESSSKVTSITNLGYRDVDAAKSFWRLKPGEDLNDEVINSYLELLRRSISVDQLIETTNILELKPHRPWRGADKLIQTGKYSIFIPIHNSNHWTFAILQSERKGDQLLIKHYDSFYNRPPDVFLRWIKERLPTTRKRMTTYGLPKQKNEVDCGLFVLMGIRLISAGLQHLSQSQSDDIIPTFRERVLAELLASTLNPSRSHFNEFKIREAQADKILPQVNPPDHVSDKSISTTANDPSHQADTPNGDNTSELFVPSSLVTGSGKDPETDSPDSLDGSEEEFVQAEPSKQKVRRKKKSPEQIASNFAEEASMVNMLREAVAIERASQKGARNPKIENIQLPDLWFMISTEKRALKQRHVHYEFSRQFWAEMGELNRSPRQRGRVPKAAISEMMSKLEITNRTNWKYILQQARRASVWTELTDIFKDDLEEPSVVLCAVPDATYTLETMTLINRKVLFETIRERMTEPGNGILTRLQAASALYWAAMHNDLPAIDLPIESGNEDLLFEEVVSFRNS